MLEAIRIQKFKGIEEVELQNCRPVNILLGRNNAGKSTVLHAIDMAGLALTRGDWNQFNLKLEMKDLWRSTGPFRIDYTTEDGFEGAMEKQPQNDGPTFPAVIPDDQKFQTVLLIPSHDMSPTNRRHQTPHRVLQQLEGRNFQHFTGLDLLYAIKHYAEHGQRGFVEEDYTTILNEVMEFFPDLTDIVVDRTDQDVATILYTEHGEQRDIMYSGAGLQHIISSLIKITASQANVVLLDEPEGSLHPELQRDFVKLITRYAKEKGIQFFITTHSPVFIDVESEDVAVFRIENHQGDRTVVQIPPEARLSIWGDIGLRPSDLLQPDIVLAVEGKNDVTFFERVAENWRSRLPGVSLAVKQYGGDAVAPIVGGAINLDHVASMNTHTLWIHDRDSPEGEPPPARIINLQNAILAAGHHFHILEKREVEFYIPEAAMKAAQDGIEVQEQNVAHALSNQTEKMKKQRTDESTFYIPTGQRLSHLLDEHLDAATIPEFTQIFDDIISPMYTELTGRNPLPSEGP